MIRLTKFSKLRKSTTLIVVNGFLAVHQSERLSVNATAAADRESSVKR